MLTKKPVRKSIVKGALAVFLLAFVVDCGAVQQSREHSDAGGDGATNIDECINSNRDKINSINEDTNSVRVNNYILFSKVTLFYQLYSGNL